MEIMKSKGSRSGEGTIPDRCAHWSGTVPPHIHVDGSLILLVDLEN